jgi:predicted transposase YdaD
MYRSHDQIFKDLLRHFPAELVRLIAPGECGRLALDTLEFQPTETFLDLPQGRARRFDLLARIETRARSPVLLHIEVERAFSRKMAARLWSYHQAIGQRHGLPVCSAVLYLRGGPPGLCACVHRENWLGRSRISFHYTSLGLSRASAVPFLKRRNPLAWGLAALMRFPGSLAEHQIACLTPIARARSLSDTQRYLLFNVVQTYLELDGDAERQYETLLAERRHREVKNMVMTWADKTILEGRKAGIRDLVLHLLSRRFSPLPAAVSRKVSAIDSPEELTSLADRIFEARSLDELGLA